MTKTEKYFIQQQIKRLEKDKQIEIYSFVGKCEKINDEIRYYRNLLKK